MADASRWSRNLSEDKQSEVNRRRLIERQKQILESKRQRSPQVTATRPPSAPRSSKSPQVKSSISRELLLSPDDAEDQADENEEEGRETADDEQEGFSNPTLDLSPTEAPAVSTARNSALVTNRSTSGRKLLTRDVLMSVDSPNDDEDEDSSPDMSPRTSGSHPHQLSSSPNPMTCILSNVELLDFVSQVIPADQTYQCTIIRDKRGIDRSLYPTYFMYLQAIVQSEEKKEQQQKRKPGITSPGEKMLKNLEGGNSMTSSGGGGSSSMRQVMLLCGRRRKKSKSYLIGSDPFNMSRDNCLAKLKSNIIGTHFSVMSQANERKAEVATIIYDANVLGFKGPRKMNILIPEVNGHEQIGGGMEQEPGFLVSAWKKKRPVIQLKNKTPVWNEDSQSYVLNFHGRVTQASVKNFQLIRCSKDESELDWSMNEQESEKDKSSQVNKNPSFAPTKPEQSTNSSGNTKVLLDPEVILQFGRISDKEFTCDMTHPLSPIQAFAIALSSFDSKLACE